MVRIFQTIEIAAPGDDVWRVAGRPECIAEFHPQVVASRLDGDRRTCVLVDGTRVVEPVLDRSIVHRFYTYELVEGPPAVRHYRCCLGVRGHGDHSHVDWDVQLVAADEAQACGLARAFDAGCREALALLRRRFEPSLAAA